ncbi:glutathione S-transferase [Tribonema minus]|uniref:Glutathione S-transferase n=1 Tax=Tribonema minus TaxID=303371 RepID=A0A835ZE16_9STRA|nr:glutathione S-transferase [Tribonema minus]
MHATSLQAPAPKLNKGFRVLELAGGVVPQGALVKVARFVWGTLWRIMMAELAPQDPTGAYVRPSYDFKGVIGSPQFPAEPGRYHVYLGQACPWCHRVSLTLALRSLNNGGITFSYMCDDPERASRGGWSFTEEQPDPVFGCGDLREVYQRCSPGYEGRCTAPLIVDSKGGPDGQGAIVSNESKDIVRMLNAAHGLGGNSIDLCPPDLEQQVEETNEWVYRLINNGVYRAGFATLQAGHDKACADVETGLDRAEQILQERRFLNGDRLTESDVFLFPTAVRFDAVYAVLFSFNQTDVCRFAFCFCMHRWMKEVYALPGVPATIDLVDIRRSYYQQLFPLNPGAIIPTGPSIEDLMESGSPSHSGSKPKLESVFYEQSRV